MQSVDFYHKPDIRPVQYSDTFFEQNKQEIYAHQKKLKVLKRLWFRPKQLLYLAQLYAKKEFYIGQANAYTGIGDMVAYSHLPRLIKSLSPAYKVYVYDSEISRIVFANNPYVDGFTKDKRRLWNSKGSRAEYGSGHLTQMKARFFGILACLPKGEIYISSQERNDVSNSPSKPIATLHAYGKTVSSPITDEAWAAVVQELKRTHYVIQLRSPDEKVIDGVDQTVAGIRECIVQQSIASIHIGIDSGFTHTAAALNIPAVVILDKIAVNIPFLKQGVHQLVLPQLRGCDLGQLYPQHVYLCVGASTPKTPPLTQTTLRMAVNGEIYPFRKEFIWNMRYS
jgi:hypothetical protein